MSASGNLCSVSDVKQHLGLGDATHDAFLSALVASASEAIENYCRRKFAATQHTEYHDGMGSALLLLDQHPVTEVSDLRQDLDRDFDAAEPISPDDYVVYPREGLLQRVSGIFHRGLRNVRVTYTAGYAAIPTDVARACVMLVAEWFNRARQGADGIEQESLGEYAATYAADGLPRRVLQMLTPYLELYV